MRCCHVAVVRSASVLHQVVIVYASVPSGKSPRVWRHWGGGAAALLRVGNLCADVQRQHRMQAPLLPVIRSPRSSCVTVPGCGFVCGRDFLTRVTLRDWEAFRQQGVIEKHMTMPTVEPEQFLWLCDRLLEAAGGGTGKGTVARAAQGCQWPTYSRNLLGRALLTRFEAEFPSTMALGLNEHSFYVRGFLHASILPVRS